MFINLYVYLLIAVPIALAVIFLLVLAILIFKNWLILRIRQSVADHKADKERSFPPSGLGLCDNCAKASRRVFSMPDGSRLCEICYTKHTNSVE